MVEEPFEEPFREELLFGGFFLGVVFLGELLSGELLSGELLLGELFLGELFLGELFLGELFLGELFLGELFFRDVPFDKLLFRSEKTRWSYEATSPCSTKGLFSWGVQEICVHRSRLLCLRLYP